MLIQTKNTNYGLISVPDSNKLSFKAIYCSCGEQCLHVKQVQASSAAVCEHTEDTDAMPEELERLVKELPFISLPLW